MQPKDADRVPSKLGAACGIFHLPPERGETRLFMQRSENIENPDGIIHGGAIATLADICATAAVRHEPGSPAGVSAVVTISLSISYLAPAVTDLYATATVGGSGRKLRHVTVDVATARGQPVARALAVMRIVSASPDAQTEETLRSPTRPNSV